MTDASKTTIVLVMILTLVVSCSSPDEKKRKFLDKGKSLYDQGDYVRARLEFKNAAQIDPRYPDAYHWLGMSYLKDNQYKIAFGYFNRAVDLDPDYLESQIQLGRLFLAAKEFDKAEKKALRVLEKQAENKDGLLLQASIHAARGRAAEARDILEALRSAGLHQPDLYLVYAAAYRLENNVLKIEEILEEGIEKNPDAVSLYYALLRFFLDQGDTEQGIRTLEKMVAIRPDNTAIKINLAGLYWDTGATENAGRLLQDIIASDDRNPEVYLQVARFYVTRNQWDAAEQVAREGIDNTDKSYDLPILLANVYIARQQSDKAIALLESSLTLSRDPSAPGIILIKNALAAIYFNRGDTADAERYVTEVLQASPRNIDAIFLKGKIDLLNGNGVDAVSAFRTVVTEKPDAEEGYLRLAQAHMANNEPALAIETLNKGIGEIPGSETLTKTLLKLYVSQKAFDRAETLLKDRIETNPDDLAARADLGDVYRLRGQFREAERAYAAVKSRAPGNPLGYAKTAGLYIAQNKPELAIRELEAGYETSDRSLLLLDRLVQLYIKHDDTAKAVTLLTARIKTNSDDAAAYDILGRVYAARKDFEKSRAAFEAAIRLQPEWTLPHNNLARLYLANDRKEDAVRKFEEAFRSNRRNVGAALSLGELYQLSNDHSRAKQVYRTLLEANPTSWTALNNLAYLMGEYPESEADIRQALVLAEKANRLKPGDPLVMDTLGWLYYRQGNYEKAGDLIAGALEQKPDQAILNYHLGMVRYRQGRAGEAESYLRKAVESEDRSAEKENARKVLESIRQS